jgi:hypothetical protein
MQRDRRDAHKIPKEARQDGNFCFFNFSAIVFPLTNFVSDTYKHRVEKVLSR